MCICGVGHPLTIIIWFNKVVVGGGAGAAAGAAAAGAGAGAAGAGAAGAGAGASAVVVVVVVVVVVAAVVVEIISCQIYVQETRACQIVQCPPCMLTTQSKLCATHTYPQRNSYKGI